MAAEDVVGAVEATAACAAKGRGRVRHGQVESPGLISSGMQCAAAAALPDEPALRGKQLPLS